jgi:hypothetical protein
LNHSFRAIPYLLPGSQCDQENTVSNLPNDDHAMPQAPDAADARGYHLAAPVDLRRRRVTSAGLAASGVILSMASRTSLAGTSNGSHHSVVNNAKPLGEPPSYWIAKAEQGNWQEASGLRCDTRFGSVFHQCSAAPHANGSLLDALHGRSGGTDAVLGQLVTAAHLNIVSGKSATVLSQADLQQMATGTFTPAIGGAAWDQPKIVAYLKLTMNSTA